MSGLKFSEFREKYLNVPAVVLRLKNLFSAWKVKEYPSKNQWRRFFKVLNHKERIVFSVLSFFFLASGLTLFFNFYFNNTEIQPAMGGSFVEGVVGQPRFINPVYSSVSDVDQDLVELIFSGLLKYDENSKIVPDLAKSYDIKNNGRVYEVYLKDDLFWSDGQPLTANDVVFTIKTIQTSDYKSPQIASWIGVEVEKISDQAVRFTLKNPYESFLENLTQKIIPQHVWKDTSPENFPLTIYNLKPTGSGPYKLKSFKQDDLGKIISLELIRNQEYYGKAPYLDKISFRFFDSEEQLLRAAQRNEIQGLSVFDADRYQALKSVGFQDFHLSLPRYFAIFFNPEKSDVLSDKNVRQALNYGTDKSELVDKALFGYGQIISSPVLPDFYGFSQPTKDYSFDQETAQMLLDKAGFIKTESGLRQKPIKKELAFQFRTDLKEGSTGKDVEALQQCLAKDPDVYPEGQITGEFGSQTKQAVIRFQEKYAQDILEPFGLTQGTGLVSRTTRAKLNQVCFPPPPDSLPLKFTLTTASSTVLVKTANLLKEQWKNLGVEIEIKTLENSQLEDAIKTRNYEALLFGEVLGLFPDPFPFWHSLQRKDPGLNLADYQNSTADALLEQIRQTNDEAQRKQKLEQFQNVLLEDAPALFLYNPDFVYFASKEIKGIKNGVIVEPSKRFAGILEWHIRTKRAWT
jgi:ABC-type transport system substrate-binding protein